MKEYKLIADAAHYEFVKELLCLLELEDSIKAEFDGEAIHIKKEEGALTWGTF